MIKRLYDVFRPFFPEKIQVVNSVGVRRRKLFDRQNVFYDYERLLVSHIRQHVRPGDNVVVVGQNGSLQDIADAIKRYFPDVEIEYTETEQLC